MQKNKDKAKLRAIKRLVEEWDRILPHMSVAKGEKSTQRGYTRLGALSLVVFLGASFVEGYLGLDKVCHYSVIYRQ